MIGNPILPVIKICANPRTVRTMSEHIDVDTSGLLQREIDLDQAGDQLLACMLATANGRWTAAEALGHREFVLTRIFKAPEPGVARGPAIEKGHAAFPSRRHPPARRHHAASQHPRIRTAALSAGRQAGRASHRSASQEDR